MPTRDPSGLSICRRPGCSRPIRFVLTRNAKYLPVDRDADPAGNVAVYRDERGTWRGRVLGNSEPHAWETVHMPHAATCAARPAPAPPQLPAGVTSLDDYRRKRTP